MPHRIEGFRQIGMPDTKTDQFVQISAFDYCLVKQGFWDAVSSESRQDFRQFRVAETLGEFRYPKILL